MSWKFWKKEEKVIQEVKAEEPDSFLNLSISDDVKNYDAISAQSIPNNINHKITDGKGAVMDSTSLQSPKINRNFSILNTKQFNYFARQGFIGYQTNAIIAQHWLMNKGLTIPPKDAIRKGYELTYNEGIDISLEDKKKIRDLDKKFKINKEIVSYVKFGRVFGIRIGILKVKSTAPDYYENPFNIDAITPNSYEGIVQVDPYWTTPILTSANTSNPSAIGFYDPTYWWIDGKKYHKSHLVIMKTDEVSDILKPSYYYGGLSYPQRVMNRIYSAEKVADEAPLLAQTKRTFVYKTALNAVKTNIADLKNRLTQQSNMQDNYGQRVIGKEDDLQKLETSLTDLDALTMTQYQIVAGEFNMPITKLLGTQLKGFSSGENEGDVYVEELESIQNYDMEEYLDRHYQCLHKSVLGQDYKFEISWNALKVMSEAEKATARETQSRTDLNYINSGVISPSSVREKLIQDKESGYENIDLEEEYDDSDFQEFEDSSQDAEESSIEK